MYYPHLFCTNLKKSVREQKSFKFHVGTGRQFMAKGGGGGGGGLLPTRNVFLDDKIFSSN
jgi:hypothetical protein